MDVMLLFAGVSPLAIGMIGLCAPFFKGKRELEELEKKYRKAKAKLERFEVRFDEQKKKIDKFSRQLESNKKEIEELKGKNRRYKDETKKVTRAGREFLDREQELTTASDSKDSALKEVQAELLEVRQKNATLAGEAREQKERCQQLERELETTRAAAEKRAAAQKATEPEPPKATPAGEEPRDDEGLQDRIRECQKSLKAKETELRVLRRKQEHNRRAYLVTMMQLDLAQDELYMLKTGKPRRDTQRARRQVPGAVPETENDQAPTVTEGAPATEDDQAPTVTEGVSVETEES